MPVPRTADQLNSQPVNLASNTYQYRFDPDSGTPIYIGVAAMGVTSSAIDWTIYKLTYSGSNITLKQTGFGAWDDRSGTVTYS